MTLFTAGGKNTPSTCEEANETRGGLPQITADGRRSGFFTVDSPKIPFSSKPGCGSCPTAIS